MPDTFVEVPTGLVYDFNGIDRPVRWDGIGTATVRAGIIAPTAATKIGASTVPGPIIGRFYAYVRYLDEYDQPSNLSPISNVVEPLTLVGTISAATNASPVVVTTAAAHGLSTGQIIQISGAYGNDAINNFWKATVLTSTTFSLDDSTGNGTYNSGGKVYTGTAEIIFENVQVATDTKVVKRQILRNQHGNTDVFYVDIETKDLTSTRFTSLRTSRDLSFATPVAIVDVDNSDLAIERYTPPPNHFSVVVHQGNRLFACRTEPYAEGCISVTNGSRTVTGIGVEWNRLTFPKRFLTVRGHTKRYEIDYLGSTSSITLIDAYTGSTDAFARYVISPHTDHLRELAWSDQALFEAWPPENVRPMPEDNGAGNLTGLLPQHTFVYVLSEYWIHGFSFFKSPNRDGFFSLAAERGCVNQRCAVPIGGVAYMLDYLGVHAFYGNDDLPISDPLRDLFRPNPNTTYRINWRASKYFHAIHDPGEGVIRWFVALSGDYTPRHALVCDYRRKRWAIERYEFPVGASCLGTMDGRPQVFYGCRGLRLFAANKGTLDGIDSEQGTVRGTATSAGPGWIADTSAAFNTTTAAGRPVIIVEGTGRGQRRLVYSATATRLNVRPCWSVRPDTTSVYLLGGISWLWRSGWFRWTDAPTLVNRQIDLMFESVANASAIYAKLYDDTQDAARDAVETKSKAAGNGIGSTKDKPWLDIDGTKQNGFVRIGLATFRESVGSDVPRFTSLEVGGVQGLDRQSIWGVEISGAETP